MNQLDRRENLGMNQLDRREKLGSFALYIKRYASSLTTWPSRSILGSLSNHDDDGNKKTHKFAYLTMKNSIFARFARAFFIFWHFEDVLVLSTTWNDLFCSCVDDVSIWWQMLNFVCLCPKRWFQFNSRVVRTHFSSMMTLNNWKMIAETRSYIFRWRSCCRRRRVCLSSLLQLCGRREHMMTNVQFCLLMSQALVPI